MMVDVDSHGGGHEWTLAPEGADNRRVQQTWELFVLELQHAKPALRGNR